MCGRFVQLPVIDFGQPGLADLAPGLAEIQPSYNLAPTQRASVILDRGEGRQVTRLAWGLLPFWAKAKGLQGSTINARIETVATKPAFRSAFKKRRCVIPMAGYYEWSVNPEDGKKDPWFIHAAGPLLAAGLWEDTSPCCPTATWAPSPSSPATAAASRPTSTTACPCGCRPARSMSGWSPHQTTRWRCCLPARRRHWRPTASAAR